MNINITKEYLKLCKLTRKVDNAKILYEAALLDNSLDTDSLERKYFFLQDKETKATRALLRQIEKIESGITCQ